MVASPAATTKVLQLRRDADRLSANLPALALSLDRIAANATPGQHGRRRRGIGESFWQFRRYEWGDDIRAIDWRRSARSQRVYICEQEWEAAQSVWLWRDGSASMDFSSLQSGESKRRRASVLALALAGLLVRGGENVALLEGNARPAGGLRILDQIALALAAEPAGSSAAEAASASLPNSSALPKYASLVLIGDFLSPLAEITEMIGQLSSRSIRGCLMQILDPAEEDLPYDGRMRFSDPEDHGELTIGAVGELRAGYRRRMAARADNLRDQCRRVGWTYLRHRSDHPAQTALLSMVGALGGDQPLNAGGGARLRSNSSGAWPWN